MNTKRSQLVTKGYLPKIKGAVNVFMEDCGHTKLPKEAFNRIREYL